MTTRSPEQPPRPDVAIVYQILQHFRDPIFSRLVSRGESAPRYRFYADPTNAVDSNRVIDPGRANRPVDEGGLPWTFVRNRVLPKPFLWQSGVVGMAARSVHDTIIFLGNMYFLSSWIAAAVARLRGRRVLFWGHGYTRRERGLQGALRALFYRIAHGHLLYGQRAKRLLVERGFDPDSLYVVYNSLDYASQRAVREATSESALAAIRARHFARPDLPLLICIGRLDARKHLDRLIDALCRLDERGLEANLMLVGDGGIRPELETHAERAGVAARVCFYGACFDEREIGPLLMSSNLCVCPGHVGLTAIHAMAYGLPVITHDLLDIQAPEVEAIEPGRTGDLYSHGDEADMIDRIARWLEADQDRDAIAASCIDVVERRYNAIRQAQTVDAAVRGAPARETETGD